MSPRAALPDTLVPQPRPVLTASDYYAPAALPQEAEPDAPSVPLSHYLWILRRHWVKMAAFVAACVLLTALVSSRLQKQYESTATIAIDAQSQSQPVGQDAAQSGWVDWDEFLDTQIRLVQSDSVLRPVAEQFRLLAAKPNSGSAQQQAAAPVNLGGVTVTRPKGTYLMTISYRSHNPVQAADVANAVAKSYLEHTYELRIHSAAYLSSFLERQTDELKARMEQSSQALAQFEKDLDVVNPDEKTNILSARLLQLNTDYAAAQADRVSKEAAWDSIKSGSLAAILVSPQGDALARLSDNLAAARQHFDLVKSIYGSSHPEYRKAATQLGEAQKQFDDARQGIADRVEAQYREALNREQMLQKEVAETKAESDQLNARSFQYQQLKQEADADRTLYEELMRKINEANINSGFQNNFISIADPARPSLAPVFPHTRLYVLMALLLSSFLAVFAAILFDSLDTTLRDPAAARLFLGTDVLGSLPVDQSSAQLPRPVAALRPTGIVRKSHSDAGKGYYPGASDFDEAVRTLRNTILLSDLEGRLRSVVLTSAVPGEGKSTLAAHLAIANADRGKRTLLVDGDLRRPSLHTKFGLSPHEGLSNVLTGELAWQDVVLPVDGSPNLSLLPSGPGSHRAADLIGPRLSSLLDEFGKEYDLVILDSPPLLGFAECLQMAAAADGILIVSRAGRTKRKAVAAVVAALNRIHANIVGVVLNQVSNSTSSEGYAYSGYYSYSQGNSAQE